MAEFPALPLFTDAFIGDTTHLTAAQTGAYLMLLMIAWRTDDCALPDDDMKLCRWARMDKRSWANNKAAVMDFWKQGEDGRWRQGRLSDERNYVDTIRNINSRAGKASALKRLNRGSTTVPTNGQRLVNPPPTPIEVSKKELANARQKERVNLQELSVEHIREWLADKRAHNRYLEHDEAFILEYFKNYCHSKNPKYRDYVAAYRNAFEWKACQPQQKGMFYDQRSDSSKWDIAKLEAQRQDALQHNPRVFDDVIESPKELR